MSSRLMPPNVGSSATMTSTSLSASRLSDLDVEHVDAGELLEKAGLAFHDRLAGERADIAETEHRSAIGDDADEIGARGECGCFGWVVLDGEAGVGDARRVGQGEVELVGQSLGRRHRDFAGCRQAVVLERSLAQLFFHGVVLFLLAQYPALERGEGRGEGKTLPLELVLPSPWLAPRRGRGEGCYFFFIGGKSVQVPSKTSAAIPINSLNVGCGWIVWPMSPGSQPISTARQISLMRSPACVPTMPPPMMRCVASSTISLVKPSSRPLAMARPEGRPREHRLCRS